MKKGYKIMFVLIVLLLSHNVFAEEIRIIEKTPVDNGFIPEQIRKDQQERQGFDEGVAKKDLYMSRLIHFKKEKTRDIPAAAVVGIESSFNFKSDYKGDMLFLGTCKNNGSIPYPFVKITSNFYDASNNFLGSAYTYAWGGSNAKLTLLGVYTNTLYPGEVGYFILYTDIDYSLCSNYSYSIECTTADVVLAKAVLNITSGPFVSNSSGYAKVSGTVTNSSSTYLTYFTKLTMCILNSSYKVEDISLLMYISGSTYNYGTGTTDTALYPAESGTFSGTFYYCAYSNAKKYIKGFEFTEVYVGGAPTIQLNRNSLTFGAVGNTGTNTQSFMISNSGSGTLDWSVSAGASSWLSASPSSGSDSGTVTVAVNHLALMAGTYTGTITVTDPNATNNPQTVAVTLQKYNTGATSSPFGDFSTPIDGSTVSSSIPVTGWALDDIEIANVKIYNGTAYVGDAVFVEGARPDVETTYSTYPYKYKAGWGYMLLSYFLPGGGNGTYTLYAKATDMEGNETTLGSKTITIDNAHAVKPFGAIDTPTPGGAASGNPYVNVGWALTPLPNMIPTSGTPIGVYVDGVKKGNATYNQYRADIASLFPGYANCNGAMATFKLNTLSFANGLHTIFWIATDNAGNSDGIGSRYFSVNNSSSGSSGTVSSFAREMGDISQIDKIMIDTAPVMVRCGYDEISTACPIEVSDEGNHVIQSRELSLVRIDLKGQNDSACEYTGYMISGSQLKPLPIGSTLDAENGVFYWQSGVGFVGEYRLVFIKKGDEGQFIRKNITIDIKPKF